MTTTNLEKCQNWTGKGLEFAEKVWILLYIADWDLGPWVRKVKFCIGPTAFQKKGFALSHGFKPACPRERRPDTRRRLLPLSADISFTWANVNHYFSNTATRVIAVVSFASDDV